MPPPSSSGPIPREEEWEGPAGLWVNGRSGEEVGPATLSNAQAGRRIACPYLVARRNRGGGRSRRLLHGLRREEECAPDP
jgi:hypothetical protein